MVCLTFEPLVPPPKRRGRLQLADLPVDGVKELPSAVQSDSDRWKHIEPKAVNIWKDFLLVVHDKNAITCVLSPFSLWCRF